MLLIKLLKYLLLAVSIMILLVWVNVSRTRKNVLTKTSQKDNWTWHTESERISEMFMDGNRSSQIFPHADSLQNNGCLLTREKCLLYIEDKLNVTPKLLSFSSDVAVDGAHRRTAQMYKEMNQPEKAADIMEEACNLFLQHGTPDTALVALEKAAKMIEATAPDRAIRLYRKGCDVAEVNLQCIDMDLRTDVILVDGSLGFIGKIMMWKR